MTRRLGLVGAGFLGRPLAVAFDADSEFSVVAVADPDAAARTAAQDDLGLGSERCYRDYEDMVRNVDLDAVVVATPPSVREPVITAAVESGLDVFCEKPLAVDAGTARQIASVVEESERTFALGYQRRLHPGYRQLRQVVETNPSGRWTVTGSVSLDWVSGLEETWKTDPATPGSGLFADTATHLLDAALWVADVTPSSVSASFVADTPHDVDTRGTLTVRGTDDELVSLTFDGRTNHTNETLRVTSESTSCRLSRGEWLSSGDMYGRFEDENYEITGTGHIAGVSGELPSGKPEAFHRFLAGEEHLLATVSDGLRETVVREAATEAAANGTHVRIE